MTAEWPDPKCTCYWRNNDLGTPWIRIHRDMFCTVHRGA